MQTAMSLEEAILSRIRALPPDKQREVLDFAESLSITKRPLLSPKGLWADLDLSVSEQDIAEIRREMWKNFPREDI
jgi:hypothetical protein